MVDYTSLPQARISSLGASPLSSLALSHLSSGLLSWFQSALMGSLNRPIRIQIGNTASEETATLAVHSFQASESVCAVSPLQLRVVCLATRSDLTPAHFLGQPVRLTVVNDTGDLRAFCAIVSQAQSVPDDGSGAQPWLLEAVDAMTLMGQSCRSRIFLGKSVLEITEIILREWTRPLGETFDFNMDQLHSADYPVREMSLQWNESDSAFLQRLWRKHGIAWGVSANASSGPVLHTLVLFDGSASFPQNAAGTLRYHVDAAVQENDAITVWSPLGRITPGSVEGRSWDYKTQRVSQVQSPTMMGYSEQGKIVSGAILDAHIHAPHWANDATEYLRLGDLRIQYHEMQASLVQGASASRDATIMTTVGVLDQPGASFGTSLLGQLPGNASASLSAATAKYSGALSQATGAATKYSSSLTSHLPGGLSSHLGAGTPYTFLQVEHWGQNNMPKELSDWMEVIFQANGWQLQPPNIGQGDQKRRYANTFIAIASGTPIIPRFDPEKDWPVIPALSATVVTPGSEEVYCDPYGRVFVQFPGLRVEDHAHAQGAGTSKTPADSAPVRVAMPAANAGAGMLQLPRKGDEVLITFINGDPDKPIITHAIHSPLNPPSSFHGINTLPGNRYLSGNRSEEIAGRNATHILHDNTPQQTSLQLHADQTYSQLTLGYLTTPRNNGKAEARGEGAELRTDAAAAFRAAQGLLISAWGRLQASGNQLDVQEALGIMQTSMDLFKSMGEYATKHQGYALVETSQTELVNTMQNWQAGTNTTPDQAALQTGIVAITAPNGIAHNTAHSILSAAGQNIDSIATQDIQHVAGNQVITQAAKGISLFSHDGGLQVIGHRGEVLMQSQNGSTSIESGEDIDIVARGNIRIFGSQIQLVAHDGSHIQIGGGITLGTNGAIQEHAASLSVDGPLTQVPDTPSFSASPLNTPKAYSQRLNIAGLVGKVRDDTVWYRFNYEAFDAKGKLIAQGKIDDDGSTDHIYTEEAEDIKVVFKSEYDDWAIMCDAEHPHDGDTTDSESEPS